MKKFLKYFVPIWLFGSVLFALSGFPTGLFSDALITNFRKADPPVESYHAAYLYKGNVVLEYTVTDRHDSSRQRVSDRYWATLDLDKLADYSPKNLYSGKIPSKSRYSIHRKLLPDQQRENLTPIPIVDLRDHVAPASDGRIKADDIFAFLNKQSSDRLPQVSVCMKCAGTQLHIRYRDPESGKIKFETNEPFDVFIPASRYPRFLILYPFALLADIVTLPLTLAVLRATSWGQ
jgi:hypothetical protein